MDDVPGDTDSLLSSDDPSSTPLTDVGTHVATRSKKLEWSPHESHAPSAQCGRAWCPSAQAEQSHPWSGTASRRSGHPRHSMSPHRPSITGQYAVNVSSSRVRWATEMVGATRESPPRPASSRPWRALLFFLRLMVFKVVLEDVRGRPYGGTNRCRPEYPGQHRANPPHSGHSGSGMGGGVDGVVVRYFMWTPMSVLLADCYTYVLKRWRV